MTKRKNDFDDVIKDLKKLKITKPEKKYVKIVSCNYRSEPIYDCHYCGYPYCIFCNCGVCERWKY